MKNELILYQSDEVAERIEVRLELDTVWLNRSQMALLFGRDIKTIGKHIQNIFKEGELSREVVVANFATTTQHGAIQGKTQTKFSEFYNLDVIISVGYRVKSKQGTQFRIWATQVLRDYLLKGYAFNERINRLENSHESLHAEVQQISLQLKTKELPNQGLFFEGQVFDAYVWMAKILRGAQKEIVLIDNYVDESVLMLLTKRLPDVKASIYTRKISEQLKLDLEKHNSQYPPIILKPFNQSHDRFLIIDGRELYHIGASIKDLGKKWFALSRMDSLTQAVLARLEEA